MIPAASIGHMPLTLSTRCAVDFGHNATVQVQDILDVLTAWFNGKTAADFDGGGLLVSEILDFLNARFVGCP